MQNLTDIELIEKVNVHYEALTKWSFSDKDLVVTNDTFGN